jgi:hypothetical protein
MPLPILLDFPIIVAEPDDDLARCYLKQFLSDPGINGHDILSNLHDTNEEIDELDIGAYNLAQIKNLMGSYFPNKLFYFSDINLLFNDIEIFPRLFSGIVQCSHELGGIVVMESYGCQNYSLHIKNGDLLLVHCHDIVLGENGMVVFRSYRNPIWTRGTIKNGELEIIENESGQYPFDFPSLEDRDIIPQMFSDENLSLISLYEPIDSTTRVAVESALSDRRNYRLYIAFYENDVDLARAAVRGNYLAFTYLSTVLRNDREFVLSLLSMDEDTLRIYPFLEDALKKDLDVIKYCCEAYPESLSLIQPISELDILIRASSSNDGVLKYANQRIKADRFFVLELCKSNWKELIYADKTLYGNIEFVEAACIAYNNFNNSTISLREILMECVVLPGGSALLPRLLPLNDFKEFNQICLKADTSVIDEIIVQQYSVESLSFSFWTKLIRARKSLIEICPKYHFINPEFAASVLSKFGSLVSMFPDFMFNHSEVYLAALKGLYRERNKNHDLTNRVPKVLRNNKQFILKTAPFDEKILLECNPKIFKDKRFFKDLIIATHGMAFHLLPNLVRNNRSMIKLTFSINSALVLVIKNNLCRFKKNRKYIKGLFRDAHCHQVELPF